MTNLDKLKLIIKDSGITMTALSKKTGINRVTLYNRLDGSGEFSAFEIMALSEALNLTDEERDEIFLNKKLYAMQHRESAAV